MCCSSHLLNNLQRVFKISDSSEKGVQMGTSARWPSVQFCHRELTASTFCTPVMVLGFPWKTSTEEGKSTFNTQQLYRGLAPAWGHRVSQVLLPWDKDPPTPATSGSMRSPSPHRSPIQYQPHVAHVAFNASVTATSIPSGWTR